MQRRAGDILGERYRLEHPLARGGMGAVWVGRHLELDLAVAIKFRADASRLLDPRGELRFKREAQLAAQLKSQHIVQIYDFAVDAGQPYIVMELLHGEDLRCRLERLGSLPLAEVGTFLTQAAMGLASAHDVGIVHRDLKPANLFLTLTGGDEILTILDFGIAKHYELPSGDDTTAGFVLGSPAYMSPEQTQGETIDCRADLWALSVVAFQALTGVQPFKGDSYVDTVQRICFGRTPRVSDLTQLLPPELDAFFGKAFARDPDRRFQTAFELAQQLALLTGQELPPFPNTTNVRGAAALHDTEPAAWRTTATVSLRVGSGATLLTAPAPEPQTGSSEGSGKRRAAGRVSWTLSADGPQHNLPALLTRFVGRELELSQICERLCKERLVTLAGTGGAGKTRLALQLGAAVLERFAHGVWFVDLAPLADASLVTLAVAQVLGVREEPGRSLSETLTRVLDARQVLLILDNCEHLLGATASLVDALLRYCPELRILATSREPLTIAGENVWRLEPLAVPEAELDVDLTALGSCDAFALFVERALVAQANFRVTQENAPLVASLCRRLDGNALALELAAARLRSLSLEQLNKRLEKRFDLLSGGSRTALPRQQTLRAAVDWSYDLLGEAARTVFRRLGIFRDGFTLEAAESVCARDANDVDGILNLLTELVDKSLVSVDTTTPEPRYRLLETLREYAQQRLVASAEENEVRERYARYFLELAEPSGSAGIGVERAALNARLHRDYANLRAVLEAHDVDHERQRQAVCMAIALGPYWLDRFRIAELTLWTQELLEKAALTCTPTEHAWLSYWRAVSAFWMAVSSRDLLVRALELFRAAGEQRGEAYTLLDLGLVAMNQGHPAEAAKYYEESLVIRRRLGDVGQVALVLCNLGETACALGDSARGEALFREAITLHRTLGESGFLADALCNLGDQALRRGDTAEAEGLLREALQVGLSTGADYYAAKTLLGIGRLLAQRDEPLRALTVFSACERALERIETVLENYARAPYEAARAQARALVTPAACEQAEARGRSMKLSAAAAYCLESAAFRAA